MATSIHETVLVGICDGAIDKKKNTSYCTNKIGDRPDLFPIITLQYPICSLCQRGLSHVVQVYCPLAASPYHRTINVFACTNPQCSGKSESWTVLRSQCLDDDIKGRQDNKTTTCTEPAMSRTDWCEDADDWGMDEEEQENVAESGVQEPNDSVYEGTDVSSKLQGLCIDGGVDQQSALQPTHVHVFQSFYISVMEETDLDGFHDTDHENELLREYEEREGVIVGEIRSCGSGEAQEEYEKATVKHGDEVFTGFMKKISLCPEQVLRKALCVHKCFHQMTLSNYIKCQHFPDSNIWYAWNPQVPDVARIWADTMLLSGLLQQQHEPRCLIREQVTLNESVRKIHKTALKDTPLEFGTVLVYTCRNSCWKSGSTVPVEEFLFVQPDPDQKLFK